VERIFLKLKSLVIILLVVSILTLTFSLYNQNEILKKEIAEIDLQKSGERFFVWYKEDTPNRLIGRAEASSPKNQWKVVKVKTPQEFEKLRKDPNIEKIQPDFQRRLMSPNDSYFNSQNSIISGQFDQWNLRSIGLLPTTNPNSAWNITTGSDSTVIAVIDTGIALKNPDIGNGSGTNWAINNLWINQSEITPAQKTLMDSNTNGVVDSLEMITYFRNNNLDINGDTVIDFLDVVSPGSFLMNSSDQDGNTRIDDLLGYNFADYDPIVNDTMGHGTHVSGVIGASTNNNSTVNPGIAGICWTCKIMPLKVVNDFGFAYDSDIVEAINYAVDKGAKVINMSLGGPGYSQPLQDAITNAWNNGVLVVSAAGNYGASASDSYPGGNSSSLSVGAIDYLDQVTWYSNTGGKLDVVAPGDYVLSTYILSAGGCIGAGYYVCSSGTSMASPHVAGLAGLLFDLHKNDPVPWTAKEVRYAILQNTSELPMTQTSRPNCTIILGSFDDCSGYGKINSRSALLSSTMPADTTNPVATLNALPAFIRGTVNITGTATDTNIYSYTISFERISDNYIVKQFTGRGNVNNSQLISVNTSTISDDAYFIKLRVEDFQGNTATTTSAMVRVDNTAPSAFAPTNPPSGSATNNPRPNFNWNASTDVNGVTYDLYYDGNLLSSNISGTNHTPSSDITEGNKTWYVVAKDPAGNTRTSNTFSLTADRVPPNNFIINSSISGSTPTFTFGATDNLSGIQGYQASLDGGAFISIHSPYSPGALSDGNHSITIRAFDNAGNVRDASTMININSRCGFLKSKADFNCDGVIDLSDLSILAARWNTGNNVADANSDNLTDLSDLSILAANWLKNF